MTCYKFGQHSVKVTLLSVIVCQTDMNDMSYKHTFGMAFDILPLCGF